VTDRHTSLQRGTHAVIFLRQGCALGVSTGKNTSNCGEVDTRGCWCNSIPSFLVSRVIHYTVGIATCYGLDGPGIESRWGEIFRTCPDRRWAHPASYTMGAGVKRQGRCVNHPPPSSAEVKERVELYLYSPSVLGRTLPVYKRSDHYSCFQLIS
jgi:hypothetical protein